MKKKKMPKMQIKKLQLYSSKQVIKAPLKTQNQFFTI